jgi:beta-glucosidase
MTAPDAEGIQFYQDILDSLKAHALTYRLVHEHGDANNQQHMVGIAKHTRAFEPMRNWAPLDRLSAASIDQAFIWDFLDAIDTGVLKITNTDYQAFIPGLMGSQDYIGINYYGRYYVESDIFDPTNPQIHFNDPADATEMLSDLHWAIYPHGFYTVLTETHRRYGLPIFVLENGMADGQMNDDRRQRFLVTHLREIWNAINYGGADIRGHMHWSFIDNFEWAEGFTARFGLVNIDYENNFKRTPRASAEIYTEIIKNQGISQELWRRFRTGN